jgi:hypothetical protein
LLPVGHIAFTWAGLTTLGMLGRAQKIDYRLAAIAALLPDLLDKPLSLTLLKSSGTSQSLGHTLLVQSLMTAWVARTHRQWLPYAIIANSHLVADQMWKYRRTLFFPFSGQLDRWRFMGTPAAMLGAYAEVASRPEVLAVEALGLGLLAWVIRAAGLLQAKQAKDLVLTGKIRTRNRPGKRL